MTDKNENKLTSKKSESSENNTDSKYNLIIIGGGASGMMAAATAAAKLADTNSKKKILIIEHNTELGKKLKITGGGRCNILNAEEDTEKLLANYGKSKKFLHTTFAEFGMQDTVDYFKNIGIEIKTEDKKRAFPISEKAMDVYKALESEMYKYKNQDGSNIVEVMLSTKVLGISTKKIENNKQEVLGVKILNQSKNNKTESKIEELLVADKYILATGGMSHAETGSTGDGFNFLKSLRLKIVEPTPGLTPIKINSKWVHKLTGKTLKDVKVTFHVDGIKRKVLNNKNPFDRTLDINILCTHFGMSGPSIINTSKDIREWLNEGEVIMSLDLFKDKDEKELDEFLLEIFDRNKNRKLRNILNVIYPQSTLESIFQYTAELDKIDLDKDVHSITKDERKLMVKNLKNLKLKVEGLMGYDKAIIADGGLELSEVNFKNMSLNLIENLYVTGDILNISRPSGGYSLQLCWTTGYVAGRA